MFKSYMIVSTESTNQLLTKRIQPQLTIPNTTKNLHDHQRSSAWTLTQVKNMTPHPVRQVHLALISNKLQDSTMSVST